MGLALWRWELDGGSAGLLVGEPRERRTVAVCLVLPAVVVAAAELRVDSDLDAAGFLAGGFSDGVLPGVLAGVLVGEPMEGDAAVAVCVRLSAVNAVAECSVDSDLDAAGFVVVRCSDGVLAGFVLGKRLENDAAVAVFVGLSAALAAAECRLDSELDTTALLVGGFSDAVVAVLPAGLLRSTPGWSHIFYIFVCCSCWSWMVAYDA